MPIWTLATIQALADLLKAAVFVADSEGHLQYTSKQWHTLSGLTQAQARLDGWKQAIHPDDRQAVTEKWSKATSGGYSCEIEFRLQHSDGSARDVLLQAAPFHEETGQGGYVGLCSDASEGRPREVAMRNLAHELNERVKELNCLFGISRVVEAAGGSLETVLRETVELLPRSWEYPEIASARIILDDSEYTAVDFEESPWCQAADLRINGEVSGRVEVVYLEERPSRDEGPFLAGERALLNAVAERIGHVVERLRAGDLLREREAELRGRLTHLTRVSAMGEMASNIAHEVNQPLTAIATYAQAGRRLTEAGTLDPSAAIDILSRIADDALRAGEIIHRLRDLVRKRDVEQVECNVNQLIREVWHLGSVDARLHDVELKLDLSDDLPTVLGDGIQIQQIVLNLVRNAVDSMSEVDSVGKEVVVRSVKQDTGYALVAVEDSGCGLPDDAEANLFQPFFTTKKEGMGVGLSISRTIATAHGGRLWYERKPPGGTIFYLELPPATEEDHVGE